MITGKSDTALSPTLVVTDDRPELKLQSEHLFPTGLAEMRFRMEPIQKRRVGRHSRSIERLAEFLDNLALVFGVFFGDLPGLIGPCWLLFRFVLGRLDRTKVR